MEYDVIVDLGDRSYPIQIRSGNLDSLGEACRAGGLTGRCLVISDENVAPLYANRVYHSLGDAGFNPMLDVLPAGEPTKCQEQLMGLYIKAAEHRLDRGCFIVALGGGVIGDLAGFAAASWLRGIRFVQVPTSLLAMVDSSVGGKTGINIAAGKNLVGAFHQPELVMIDSDTLQTLPPREFAAGMAEVVKYGIIWDTELFHALEGIASEHYPFSQEEETMGKIIARCCEIKAEVVRLDEREGGLRGILNFGHTVAHAIENVAGYGQYLHGEAVAIGMVYATHLSVALKDFSFDELTRIEKLLASLTLPIGAPTLRWEEVRAAITLDKKTVAGLPKFVLCERLGSSEVGCDIPEELLEEIWYAICQ